MRHRKSFNHLGRTSSHRNAMLANMAASLILHKRIETTTAKAKALRSYIEPLITKSKEDTTHSRRLVFSYLQNKEAVAELFREVALKVHDRPGGYTRVLKLGARLGDSAEMSIIELVDFNENLLGEVAGKAKPGRRRRGPKKKDQEKAGTAVVASAAKEEKAVKDTDKSHDKADIAEEAFTADAEPGETDTEDKMDAKATEESAPVNEEVATAEDKTEDKAEKEDNEQEKENTDLK